MIGIDYEKIYSDWRHLRYELMDVRKLEKNKKAKEYLDDAINNMVEIEPLLRELSVDPSDKRGE